MRFISRWLAAVFAGLALAGPFTSTIHAQTQTGIITGRIVHTETGAALPDVVVQVEGTPIGAKSGPDGRFRITGIPAGTVTITARRLGLASKSISNIIVTAGKVTEQDISLASASTVLAAQHITAAAEKGTVSEALEQQRNATAIVNAITAEQISKSPDGDAAAAMQRVSGVTVQDNKYIIVRGLGERYTTASLNGARLPSPEPERKVVPLDLFPAGLLENVTTSKTFTPDQPGDFSGAQVDIKTREFPVNNVVSISTSTGFNSLIGGRNLVVAPTVGQEWLGFAGGARSLPDAVKQGGNFGGASQADINSAIRSFRNTWTPQSGKLNAPGSISISAGGQTDFMDRRLGYVASGSYSYSQSIRSNERYASVGNRNAVAGQSSTTSAQLGGLLNLSFPLSDRTRIAFNNTYNRTADNEAQTLVGVDDNFNGDPARFSTLSFVERSIRSNQLEYEHVLDIDRQINITLSSAGVRRYEPDRSDVEYVQERSPDGELLPFVLFARNLDGARRTFMNLRESNWSASTDIKLGAWKVGGAFRTTRRRSENYSYSITSFNMPREILQQSPEEIFSSEYLQGDAQYFSITRNSTGGSYTARDYIGAVYGMWERPFWDERLRLIAGARIETTNLEVRTQAVMGGDTTAKLNNIDILPSVIANFRLTNDQNLRFSVTQTLARPEYRELSPTSTRNVAQKIDQVGNPNLVRSLIQNVDARWEWFPNVGEVISLGVFYKHFNKPIERIIVATSGANQFGYINANAASNYGVEGEVRKALPGVLSSFTGFVNVTLMQSRIDLSGNTLSSLTNAKRPMQGQSPYVFNTGLTYANESGRLSTTVLYNIVGKRIVAAGGVPQPDVYELARPSLDASIRFPVFSTVSMSINASNLLDRPYEERQGDVVRSSYRTGRSYSVGLSFRR